MSGHYTHACSSIIRLSLTGLSLLFLAACGGGGGGGGGGGASADITLTLKDFQKAAIVIGQQDFESRQPNQGDGVDAHTIGPLPTGGAGYADNILYLGDRNNNRVLGYRELSPTNSAAKFVLGQPATSSPFNSHGSGTAKNKFHSPIQPTIAHGKLFVPDFCNNRVLIFNPAPKDSGSADYKADVVVGSPDYSLDNSGCDVENPDNIGQLDSASDPGCDAKHLFRPETVDVTPDGKLVVADRGHHRVLIWDSVPDGKNERADLVLGQQDFDHCAANEGNTKPTAETLNEPAGIWTDGDKLVVLDSGNNRALIWTEFPDTNQQKANLVLGQATFNEKAAKYATTNSGQQPSALSLDPFVGVDSNGTQLVIADDLHNRVLIWDHFPTKLSKKPDHVLGQSDFEHGTQNDNNQNHIPDNVGIFGPSGHPTARTLFLPEGVKIIENKTLVVTDSGNNRYLIFKE